MFDRDHGIIVSCDSSSKERLKQIISATCGIDGIAPRVGGEMTHPDFFDYINDAAPEKIYSAASLMGVEFFVVPGTKPERMKEISGSFPGKKFCFPGIGTQGGDLAKAFESIDGPSYAIIGSAICDSAKPAESAKAFASISKRF